MELFLVGTIRKTRWLYNPFQKYSYKKYHKHPTSEKAKTCYLLFARNLPSNLYSMTLSNGYYYYKSLNDEEIEA